MARAKYFLAVFKAFFETFVAIHLEVLSVASTRSGASRDTIA
jgi:hypothetical protein